MRPLLIALCAVAAACGRGGSTPTSPSAPPAADLLLAGAYTLSLTGFDFSNPGAMPECTPLGVPPAGKTVRTELALARDGAEWVARLASSDADVELRVRDEGPSPSGHRMSGLLRGWLTDRGSPSAPGTGVVATVEATATGAVALLDGEVPALLPSSVFATALGTIVFRDAQGRAATCPRVQLSLGRVLTAGPPAP